MYWQVDTCRYIEVSRHKNIAFRKKIKDGNCKSYQGLAMKPHQFFVFAALVKHKIIDISNSSKLLEHNIIDNIYVTATDKCIHLSIQLNGEHHRGFSFYKDTWENYLQNIHDDLLVRATTMNSEFMNTSKQSKVKRIRKQRKRIRQKNDRDMNVNSKYNNDEDCEM